MNKENNPPIHATHALALELHGSEYYPHLARVRDYFLELVALLPEGLISSQDRDDGEHATLLHDSIEDHHITREELELRGYRQRVLEIIKGLTRDPAAQTYHDKMLETSASGDVVLILAKLADNRDNSTPERIADLPVERRSLINRYRKARRTLFDGLASLLRQLGVEEEKIREIEQWLGNRDTAPW
ncbi:hypothetical protein G6L37_04635 [Agrobacterium rubi]|nr:hypothetical protein [Agrobacterium rubi]NTF24640.1 hypothetical protein [Agrobacterium rubi]